MIISAVFHAFEGWKTSSKCLNTEDAIAFPWLRRLSLPRNARWKLFQEVIRIISTLLLIFFVTKTHLKYFRFIFASSEGNKRNRFRKANNHSENDKPFTFASTALKNERHVIGLKCALTSNFNYLIVRMDLFPSSLSFCLLMFNHLTFFLWECTLFD